MQKEIIELQQQRDFGDLINVTFKFVIQNFKKLGGILLTYAGPFILIGVLLESYGTASLFSDMAYTAYGTSGLLQSFSFGYIAGLIIHSIGTVLLLAIIYNYMKLYKERGGADNFTKEEVWQEVKESFLMIVGSSVLIGLMIFAGILLLIVPGIYISIPLSLLVFMRVIEKNSFGDALSRSFYLIKEYWWFTLGLMVVIGFITYIAAMVFMIPQMIMSIFMSISFYSGSGEGGIMRIIFIIVNTISTFGYSLIFAVPYTTTAFQYYNLVERKDNPGILDRISKINNPDEPKDDIKDLYPDEDSNLRRF